MFQMINKITDAISEAIYDEFGDGHEIYTEEVEQGLQEPCFAIIPLNLTNDLYRNKRYYRKNPFCIHYFPSTNDKRNECNNCVFSFLFRISAFLFYSLIPGIF